MESEVLGLILFYSIAVPVFVLYAVFTPPSLGEPSWDAAYIENVSFVGLSGDDGNSVVLYVRNVNADREIVLDSVNIACSDWEEEFSISPGESSLPAGVSGSVVLFNVGWVEGLEYKIKAYSSKGDIVGSISVIA